MQTDSTGIKNKTSTQICFNRENSFELDQIKKVGLPLVKDSATGHIPTMSDFLTYLRQEKARLRKRLHELDVAERIFLDSRDLTEPVREPEAQGSLLDDAMAAMRQPKTIKAMVVELLNQVAPGGLTAMEILEQIQLHWKPGLERTSLSPQLTRLKDDGAIVNSKGKWFLASALAGTDRSNESTPESGKPSGVL